MAVEEPIPTVAVPDDLSLSVDAVDNGFKAAWGIDRRVYAAAVKETVVDAAAVLVKTDDLSLRVNALGEGRGAGGGINRCVAVARCRLHLPIPFQGR
jgi:hypothetical protein